MGQAPLCREVPHQPRISRVETHEEHPCRHGTTLSRGLLADAVDGPLHHGQEPGHDELGVLLEATSVVNGG